MQRRSNRTAAIALAGALAASLMLVLPAADAAPLGECAPATTGGDWPMMGHDLHNTRSQPEEDQIGPAEAATLAPAFTFSSVQAAADAGAPAGEAATAGDFTGTPVIADGCIFAGSNGGWVFAANADTGETVWATRLPQGGTMPGSPSVVGGRVYLGVNNPAAGSYAVALDQASGEILATSPALDTQQGHDVLGSPTVFDADPGDGEDLHAFIGISGWGAESDFSPQGATRYAYDGAFVILDADDLSIAQKTFTVADDDSDAHAGCGIWSTAAFDGQHLYVGTSNPFRPESDHEHCNAIVKVDGLSSSPGFGAIVDSYKGTREEYVSHFVDAWPCVDVPGVPRPTPSQQPGTCPDMDLAMGAAPTLFPHSDGRLLVGAGQKSGIYHAADTASMDGEWSQELGIPTLIGGIVGSAAFDGEALYGPHTTPAHMWSVNRDDGSPRWVMPGAGPVAYGNSVTVANGVAYKTDQAGILNAHDAATGRLLLAHRIEDGSDAEPRFGATQGSVSVARNTVYTAYGTNSPEPGYIVAFRPGGAAVPGVDLPEVPGGPEAPGVPGGLVTVAGTGAAAVFAPPEATILGGTQLQMANGDIQSHNVTSTDPLLDEDGNEVLDSRGRPVPLFASPTVGASGPVPVERSEDLAGGTYAFFCSVHPSMRGNLTVVAS